MDNDVRGFIKHHEQIHEMESKALEVQAKEYERRLVDLNHAHEKAQQDKAEFVNKETYEGVVDDLRALIEIHKSLLEKVINESARNKEKITGLEASIQWLGRMLAGAIVVGLVALAVKTIVP